MPAGAPWYVGQQVPLAPPVNTDGNGVAQDASGGTGTVVFTVTLPDGTTATPAAVHGQTGVYTAVYVTTQAGHHIWAVTIPGTTPGAFTDSFEVQSNSDATIVSLAEAKEILKAQSTGQYDQIIQGFNGAITNWIEFTVGPCVQRTVTETLPAEGSVIALSNPPVLSLVSWTQAPSWLANSGIAVPSPGSPMFPVHIWGTGTAWPTTLLSLDPARGLVWHQAGLPFYFGPFVWQYNAGRLVIPWGIYEASKIALKHLYAVERGGQAGGTQAAYGQSEAGVTMTPFGFAVPNRAIELLEPFRGAQRAAIA